MPLFRCSGALPFLLLVLSVSALAQETAPPPPAVSVDGDRLVDAEGRTLFLRGMNAGSKSPENFHAPWQGPEDFRRLRDWGMTAVRYMIFWSAIEPAPGQYSEEYLQGVDRVVSWAADAGIHVILDMHQDLYGPGIPGGDGAPAWATLDDGLPHRTLGSIWSTAYLVSPKIHRAFDNFWNNAPGPDGVGIQDHFALAWRHVAQRYRNNPTVIGFDILNEPFVGSDIRRIAWAVWMALPDFLRGAEMPRTPAALMESLKEEPYPWWLLKAAGDPRRYERFLAAVAPAMQAFERRALLPMYQRVYRAVREVHPTGIFVLEPCVLANSGAPSAIEPLVDDQGRRDPLQAYMPHFYDIVLDTGLHHEPSPERLGIMMRNRVEEARRMGMPLLIGEWGAFYGDARCVGAAEMMARFLAENTVGEFYWDYHRDIEQGAFFPSLSRPSPLRVGGFPVGIRMAESPGGMQVEWTEETAPAPASEFHLPEGWVMEEAASGGKWTDAGTASVPGAEKPGVRKVTLRPAP